MQSLNKTTKHIKPIQETMFWKQNINPFQPTGVGPQNVKGNILSQKSRSKN